MKPEIPDFKTDFNGPIIIIGFGSIGRGLLPLLARHVTHTYKSPITIICPDDANQGIAELYNANFVKTAVTRENFHSLLEEYTGNSKQRGLIINVANEVSSKAIMQFASEHNCFYIDTVVEPWPGFYYTSHNSPAEQSNYSLREDLFSLKNTLTTGTPTAISCCGANPGMVSWLVKSALIQLAHDTGIQRTKPQSRSEWATLMCDLDIKGVHIAEHDMQVPIQQKNANQFINTWSVDGFIAEGLQPAELGWGTHEEGLPHDGESHDHGGRAAIYLKQPGMETRVRTWTPTLGPHEAFLITHNEAISISDYYSLRSDTEIIYRPTCLYAYHPTDVTVASIEEMNTSDKKGIPQEKILLGEADISTGSDQLGVLLYGNNRGSLWFGSTLSIETTRSLAPFQNSTGLQVTSAIIAGIFYCIAHPEEGLIETDEMDFEFCLKIQRHYLGDINHYYTDWEPLRKKSSAPWQFSNIRVD
jgi:homospermidine synthase